MGNWVVACQMPSGGTAGLPSSGCAREGTAGQAGSDTDARNMIGRITNLLSLETTTWFRFEKQIHALLLSDPAFSNIREILESQIVQFHHATRGFGVNTASATFSYDLPLPTWKSNDRELLAKVIAENAEGAVFTGSGVLASIEIRTTKRLGIARLFKLRNPRLCEQKRQELGNPVPRNNFDRPSVTHDNQ
jgi:hypothetical protein